MIIQNDVTKGIWNTPKDVGGKEGASLFFTFDVLEVVLTGGGCLVGPERFCFGAPGKEPCRTGIIFDVGKLGNFLEGLIVCSLDGMGGKARSILTASDTRFVSKKS